MKTSWPRKRDRISRVNSRKGMSTMKRTILHNNDTHNDTPLGKRLEEGKRGQEGHDIWTSGLS